MAASKRRRPLNKPSAVVQLASAALALSFASAFAGGFHSSRDMRPRVTSAAHLTEKEPAGSDLESPEEVVVENSSQAIRLLRSPGLRKLQATLEKLQAAEVGDETAFQAMLKNIPRVVSNISEQEMPTDLEADFEEALERSAELLSPEMEGENLGPIIRQLLQLPLLQRLPEMIRRLGRIELLYPKALENQTEVSQDELREALAALAQELNRADLARWSDEDFTEAQNLIQRNPVLGPLGESLADTADDALAEFYATTAGAAASLIFAQLALVVVAFAVCASCFGDGSSDTPVPTDTTALPLYTLGGTVGGR
ncbi:unnamed protein product [Symbiodinium natans]|uniref:Uncharacterized protein n=1 Tax=Symbiodinium natans TaxID=878477 RepID=A0A812RP18_9DINO|nr:unnamed protein product [Symbiodinium natans]